jgi:hypothetical protein
LGDDGFAKVVVEGMFLKAKVAAAGPKISRKPVQTEDRCWDAPGFVASSLSLAEAEVAVPFGSVMLGR